MIHDHTSYSSGDALIDGVWVLALLILGAIIFRMYLRTLAADWYKEKRKSQIKLMHELEKGDGPNGQFSE